MELYRFEFQTMGEQDEYFIVDMLSCSPKLLQLAEKYNWKSWKLQIEKVVNGKYYFIVVEVT